jgi:steroid 5-alpha reductase family enzyme
MTVILLSLAVSLAVNAAFFVFALWKKTDLVTDLSYSFSFALVSLVLLVFVSRPTEESGLALLIVACVLVWIWALRLGAYLFGRILRVKVDHRFDGIREHPGRFARFWLLQAISVAIVMLPVSYLLGRSHAPEFGVWSAVGVAVWFCGFAIEALSDAQKSSFKKINPASFVSSGLWRWSRHPNYFGEMLVWWGLFLFAVPFLHGAAFVTVIGPLYITALLLFVTGIPPLEKSAEQKYGDDSAYREYKRRTSLLVPLPPRR